MSENNLRAELLHQLLPWFRCTPLVCWVGWTSCAGEKDPAENPKQDEVEELQKSRKQKI